MDRRRPRPSRSIPRLALVAVMAVAVLAPLTRVSAQDATPAASPAASPTGTGETIRSQTREEFRQQLEAHYALEEPRPGGTLIDSTVGEFRTLNPIVANDAGSIAAVGYVYDYLVGASPIDGQPAPSELADRWEIAPDGVTYTFFLNTDARWHDGEDFTAEDVVFSFDAQASPDTGSSYTGLFESNVASYRAIDDDTVEVVANGQLAGFLIELGYVYIVPKHLWENVPFADWASDPGSTGQDTSRVVGTGPFRFQEWVQGESITFTRNEEFYGVVPALETYILRTYTDTEAAINALQSGEIDITGLSPASVEDVDQTPGIAVKVFDTAQFLFYAYNLDPEKTTLFQDQEVRQALFYALDRESIARDIDLGYSVPAQGIHAPFNFAYQPERLNTRYDHDPARARELLAAAGWVDNDGDGIVEKDGQPLSFEMSYPIGDATTEQYVAYMQDAWAEIGVEMTPNSIEFNALVDAVSVTFDFEMAMLSFGEEVTGNQYLMFNCDQYQVGFNLSRYCNPQVDEFNNQARLELDQEARSELLLQAENLIHDDLPVAIVTYAKAVAGYSERLHNYIPGPFGGAGISYLWIEEA